MKTPRIAFLLVFLSLSFVEAEKRPQGFASFLENTLVFPQFVVGSAGGFSFDAELRIANTGSASFQGVIEIIDDELFPALSIPVLVNGEPHPFQEKGISFLLEREQSTRFVFTPVEAQEGASGRTAGETQGCIDCFAYVQCDGECETVEGPAGTTTSRLDDLVVSFYYNVRDDQGKLVDKVNVPPSRGGDQFAFVMGRGQGFETGVAIVSDPTQIDVTIQLPEEGGDPAGGPNFVSLSYELDGGRDDFFLTDLAAELPEEIPAALVRISASEAGIPLWGVALGVQVEDGNVQISGQEVQASDFEGPVITGSRP